MLLHFLYTNEQSYFYLNSWIYWSYISSDRANRNWQFSLHMVLQTESEQCIFLSVFESRARSWPTFMRQEWTERALFCPPSPGPGWSNLALAQQLLAHPFVMQAGYQVLGFPSAEAVGRAHKPVCNRMDGFSSQPSLLPGGARRADCCIHHMNPSQLFTLFQIFPVKLQTVFLIYPSLFICCSLSSCWKHTLNSCTFTSDHLQ